MKKALLLLLFLASYSGWVSAQNPGDLDLTFAKNDFFYDNVGESVAGNITSFDFQSDGKIIIAGDLSRINIEPLARLNPDRSLDNRYDFGLGANGKVQKVLQKSDGKLLAIGSFNRFDGEKRSGAVRIHGVLDEVAPLSDFEVIGQRFDSDGLGVLSGLAWIDYDIDGDLDLASGNKIYLNDGLGVFQPLQTNLPLTLFSKSNWGDYDNDGDLDVLLSWIFEGQYFTSIFSNNGNEQFTDIQAGLVGLSTRASASWGDFDNDGDLDFVLMGDLLFDPNTNTNPPVSKIYRNDGPEGFIDIEAEIKQVFMGSAEWADYDNDGDLDLVISGKGYSQNIEQLSSTIYRNDGNGSFVDINAGLENIFDTTFDWGDYDSDGDLDLLMSGERGGTNGVNRIYKNEGGDRFTSIDVGIQGLYSGIGSWGDYENDGDLDVVISGVGFGFQFYSKVYKNLGGDIFEEIDANLSSVFISRGGWGDYDNDGDIDLAISGLNNSFASELKVYQNNHVEKGGSANAKPTTPLNLVSTPNPAEQKMRFEWEAASDAETPVNSLSYNLFIREVGSASYSKTPEALESDGWRLVPGLGNASLNTFSEWNYSEADKGKTFEWSVQAIDGAFSGGQFAESGFFTLDNTPPTLVNQSGTFDTDASRAFTQADLSADDDETPADQLVFTIKSLPLAGTLSFDGVAVEIGHSFTQADIAAGKLSYQNTVNTAKTDSFTFTFTDLFMNETGVETFSITLNDVTPPVAIAQNVTVILGAINGQASITPQQVNNGSSDNFTAGANLFLSLNQTNFSCADIGNNPTVTLTVTDENGNSTTAIATVTVLDETPPAISLRNNITLDLDANGTATLTESGVGSIRDNCGIASFTLGKSQFTCADLGIVEVEVIVTDLSGNSSAIVASVMVRDRINPLFVNLPKSISVTLAEGEPYMIPDFSGFVSDNCGVSSYTQSILGGTVITTAGTYNVNINVADASGKTAKATVKIVRAAPKTRKNPRLNFENTELVTVPWNTAFEEVISGLEVEENLAISWIEDGYDRLTPGIYQVKAMSSPQLEARFSSSNVLNILVQDKPKALDIELSSTTVPNQPKAGDQIALLSTVDPVDDIHTYCVGENSNLAVEGNKLVWKSGGVPAAQMKVTVFSTDRAGQTISKEITLFRELKIGEFLIYPNPAAEQTNVLVELDEPSQVSLSVFDAVGRLVISDQFSRETTFVQTLDLNGLAPGMYTVQIQVGKMVMTGRLIKK